MFNFIDDEPEAEEGDVPTVVPDDEDEVSDGDT